MDDVDQKLNAAFIKFWYPFSREYLEMTYTEHEELVAKVAFIAGVKHMLEVINETKGPAETDQ